MTVVKICGVTTLEDALLSAEAGAQMLGLNFYPPSPRSLSVEAAAKLAADLRSELADVCPLLVGVFVNETAEHMQHVMKTVGLDAVQLSGDEPIETLVAVAGRGIVVIRPRNLEEAITQTGRVLAHSPLDMRLPSLILDAYHPDLYGGTGEQASIEVARAIRTRVPRLMLAGGLTPENVAERVGAVRPWGVDVASGVEGAVKDRKDSTKVRDFIAAARSG
jgi:phosphoribosylanthranilate isomerase